ncbi:hypothetical protein ACFZAR_39890 [Streptomyces sp. NPDC008222]|uniref:hypothetical protein n=1 Tax=Streptomyces sp. NPDC008222 TaxID=3364820 RepID=UPI0036E9DEC7
MGAHVAVVEGDGLPVRQGRRRAGVVDTEHLQQFRVADQYAAGSRHLAHPLVRAAPVVGQRPELGTGYRGQRTPRTRVVQRTHGGGRPHYFDVPAHRVRVAARVARDELVDVRLDADGKVPGHGVQGGRDVMAAVVVHHYGDRPGGQ